MKEILYIQAGNQANYTGTHFWNTQESYFTYEEGEDADTDHGISFREGLNQKGEPTFCPRLLSFDHKAQFGTLSQANALFGMDPTADEQILWSGNPVEYKQEPVRQSHYQTDMEELNDVKLEDVRYWSDFNRLYYVPRTVQKVPDVPEWADAEGNWTGGQDMFARYDEDTGLMEGPLRLFLEECETIQGIQLMHDTSTFGSFMNSLLTTLRDDFGKLPLVSLPLLSDATPSFNSMEDPRRRARKLINDALTLRGLSELSSISAPVQSPTTWTDEVFTNTHIQSNRAHAYHTSAILSAHIETATLPLRLRATTEDIQSLSGQLSWQTAVPFVELAGIFPYDTLESEWSRLYNFSSSRSRPSPVTQFARRDVTRGFSHSAITSYNERLASLSPDSSVVSSTHAAAYPLPTSFPAFFRSAGAEALSPQTLSRPRATPLFSSLSATTGTADLFAGYARFLDDSVRRKISVEDAGIDLDELGDLANDFWTLHDTAGGDTKADRVDSDEDGRGEDED
ncbi:mtDNA inheritance protein Dml1 [Mycena filopes]|nr:mtDNA inheritance protein Dml1 [Mycena filopes]